MKERRKLHSVRTPKYASQVPNNIERRIEPGADLRFDGYLSEIKHYICIGIRSDADCDG
jgi:hypothetical protein